MGCSTCSTKSGGEKSGGCSSGGGCGCNKKNTFDWLAEMDMPGASFPLVEVRFKGGRKEFFRNMRHLDLTTGDFVVVETPKGHHLGTLSLQGELVRLQMRKKGVATTDESLLSILRIATPKDVQLFEQAQNRELPTLYRAREIITRTQLKMKLSDVEYQADNTKATFYYSANNRIDFRELIKELAAEFRVRIEMRQISLREEAGRLGGIGVCGLELCCSTWMTGFKNVSTSAARYQNLALNPAKLSGQCGRLKCCLNYELDTYIDALREIPKVDQLKTEKGVLAHRKTDIFKQILWFSYPNEDAWYPLNLEQVNRFLDLNKKGQKAPAPAAEAAKHSHHLEQPISFEIDLSELEDDSEASEKESDRGSKHGQKQRGNRPQERNLHQKNRESKPFIKPKQPLKPEHKPERKGIVPEKTQTNELIVRNNDRKHNNDASIPPSVKIPPRQKSNQDHQKHTIKENNHKNQLPKRENPLTEGSKSNITPPKAAIKQNPARLDTNSPGKFKKPQDKRPFNKKPKNPSGREE